jgi:chromosome partitioning protein
MTQNALAASSWYVITAIPDHLSTIGLGILHDKVRKIGDLAKSACTIAGEHEQAMRMAALGGVIFVKVRLGGTRITTTHRNFMQAVADNFARTYPQGLKELRAPHVCFPVHTTELIGYGEAAENFLPVWKHDSANARTAADKQEYFKITEEFLRRFDQ